MLLPSPLSHEIKFTEVYSSKSPLVIAICDLLKISSRTPSKIQTIDFSSPINEANRCMYVHRCMYVCMYECMYRWMDACMHPCMDVGRSVGWSVGWSVS